MREEQTQEAEDRDPRHRRPLGNEDDDGSSMAARGRPWSVVPGLRDAADQLAPEGDDDQQHPDSTAPRGASHTTTTATITATPSQPPSHDNTRATHSAQPGIERATHSRGPGHQPEPPAFDDVGRDRGVGDKRDGQDDREKPRRVGKREPATSR